MRRSSPQKIDARRRKWKDLGDVELFPENPPYRGKMAGKNRSQRLFQVMAFFRSLNPHLPPESQIKGHFYPEEASDGQSVIATEFFWQAPIGAIKVFSLYERADIASPTDISDEWLKALEECRERARALPPHEAAEQFRGHIAMAEYFFQAYEDDKEKAVWALDRDDPAPLCELCRLYGGTIGGEDSRFESLLGKLANRMLTGDKEAGRVLKAILDVCLEESSGRPRQEQTEEEKRQRNRQRKRDFDSRFQAEKKILSAKIAERIRKLPVQRDGKRYRQEIEKIKDALLAEALSSQNGARRAAAQKLRSEFERQRSHMRS